MAQNSIISLVPKSNVSDLPADFQIQQKTVLFFSSNDELSQHVISNLNEFHCKLEELGYKFTVINSGNENEESDLKLPDVYQVLEYKFPVVQAAAHTFEKWYMENSVLINNKLQLFLTNYTLAEKKFQSGFYIKTDEEYFFSGSQFTRNFTEFRTVFFDFVANEKQKLDNQYHWGGGVLFSPVKDSFEDDIEIEKSAIDKIRLIDRKLRDLMNSGEFYLIIPMLQKYLEEYTTDFVKPPTLSLKISPDDFRVSIEELNVEVKLNALTKSIYFLFLSVGEEGIHPRNLSQFGNYLLRIYKSVSNRTDLDQLNNTIRSLIDNNNQIYMHLSRIKSAFCEVMDDAFAKQFYVNGKKNENKFIPIETCMASNISDFYQIWGVPSFE